jgi:hypothetical protein
MRDGERTNFCDVHFGWVPGDPIDRGVYSGPKEAVNEITRYARSHEAIARYRDKGEVRSDLALTAGGIATLVHSHKRKTFDVWMFGPLLFEGAAYGSLVAELTGLELGKHGHKFTPIDEKTGKEREKSDPKYQRFLVKFPKDYSLHYHPCKLWGSTYADGNHPSKWIDVNVIYDGGSTVHFKDDHAPGEKDYVPPGYQSLVDALREARTSLTPAFLPKNAVKVVWKIEDYASDQTVCQIYSRKG